MKISRTVPGHEIIIPDRIEIGKEHWNTMTAGDTTDIDTQQRLQEEEYDRLIEKSDYEGVEIDMKLFEKLKVYVVEKVLSYAKDPKIWIGIGEKLIRSCLKKLETPEQKKSFSDWLDAKLNLPFLDEDHEAELFPEFVDWLVEKLNDLVTWIGSLK